MNLTSTATSTATSTGTGTGTRAIAALTRGERLRVWSFVVTLFGDLARGPRDRLTGAALTAMTGRVGIKPASMRVALHRLRKDGWLDSRKAGRTSQYFLTAKGREETLRATARIYARHSLAPKTWFLAIAPEGRQIPAQKAGSALVPVLPGVHLGLGEAPELAGFLCLPGSDSPPPDWLRRSLISEELSRQYHEFEARLDRVSGLLPQTATALERAVLRGLIVHGWRRLILRHPELPEGFPGPQCRVGPTREKVHALLDRLPKPPLAALDDAKQ